MATLSWDPYGPVRFSQALHRGDAVPVHNAERQAWDRCVSISEGADRSLAARSRPSSVAAEVDPSIADAMPATRTRMAMGRDGLMSAPLLC